MIFSETKETILKIKFCLEEKSDKTRADLKATLERVKRLEQDLDNIEDVLVNINSAYSTIEILNKD